MALPNLTDVDVSIHRGVGTIGIQHLKQTRPVDVEMLIPGL